MAEECQANIESSEYDSHCWLIIPSSDPVQMMLAACQFLDGLLLACLLKALRRVASSAAFQYFALLMKGHVA